MVSGLFYVNSLDVHFQLKESLISLILLPCFNRIPVFDANSVDPDHTLLTAASDLGLYCLPKSLLSLRKHAYSNILKILQPKTGKFTDKKF